MVEYNDNWRFLNDFVNMKIGDHTNNLKAYWVKVLTSTGYYVSCKFATSEEAVLPMMQIPVMQSKYHSPIVMPGDEGLLINLHQNLDPQLSGKTSQEVVDSNYYAFLPLISKSNYKGEFNKQRISNSLLNTYIELADDGITFESIQKIEIKSAESITIETKQTTLSSTDALQVTSKEITIKGDSKITLESGGDLTIKASSPIELGTSQQLGKALNDLCTALASFMTLPVSPGAPAAPDPGFISKVTQVQTALSQILKS